MGSRCRLVAAAAICLVGIGCSPDQSPSGSRGPYEVATDGGSLILSVSAYGGMNRAYYNWSFDEPEFLLYGDGRVIASCDPDVSEPPVLPCVNETHVSPDEIQRIIVAADAADLLSDASFDDYLWTDDETTVFKTTVGGATHKVEAYALDPNYPSTDVGVKAARQRLIAFHSRIQNLDSFLGRTVEMKPYAPKVLLVRIHQVDPSGVDAQAAVRTWPLSVDPADGTSSSLRLTADDMAILVAAAQRTTVAEIWQAPSGYYEVSAHPCYPDE